MRKKKPPEKVTRKVIAALVDVRLADSLKEFSKEVGKPIYIMIEEALRTYLLRQKKIHGARIKRKKEHSE